MTITQAPLLDQNTRTFVRLIFTALLWTCPALAEPPPAFPSPHPLAGKVWSPATGRWSSPQDLIESALGSGIVLLGETHDNPGHHALQAWVVRELAAAGRRPVVALEMVDTDQQPALDRAVGDLATLGDALGWEKRGWPAWPHYRPIAEAALAAHGEIKAANLPRELSQKIVKGSEGAEVDGRYGLDQKRPEAEEEAMEADIRDSHCNLLPESMVPAMVRVQRARDAAMAEVLAEQSTRPEAGPAVLVAGAGHGRTDRGVPARLGDMVPGIRALSIAFVEVDPAKTAPAAYASMFGATALPFDLVWFTGRQSRPNPCGQLEKHMKKKDGAGKT